MIFNIFLFIIYNRNHLTEGETHVPKKIEEKQTYKLNLLKDIIGIESFAILQIFLVFFLGWYFLNYHLFK